MAVPNQGIGRFGVWWRSTFWFLDGYFLVCSRGGRDNGSLRSLFNKGSVLMTSSPSKPSTSKSQHVGDKISTDEFGEIANIQLLARTYTGRKSLKYIYTVFQSLRISLVLPGDQRILWGTAHCEGNEYRQYSVWSQPSANFHCGEIRCNENVSGFCQRFNLTE